MAWTPERIAEVRSLAESGLSARQIAFAIGNATRNAVVGCGHRNGIKFQGVGGGPNRNGRTGAKKKPVPIYMEPSVITCVEMPHVTLHELQSHMCRFPLGDPMEESFRYCGKHKVDGHSYCAGHCRLAYRSPEESNAQP